MTPDHASKKGLRYRYYASQPDKESLELPNHRLPAGEIEKLVSHQLVQNTKAVGDGQLLSRELVQQHIAKVTVHANRIEIRFVEAEEPITIEASLISCGNEVRIDAPSLNWSEARRDPSLIKLIVRAHQARQALNDPANASIDQAASSMELSKQYFCRLLRLAYLAPDITAAILDGKQPPHINRQFLARVNNIPDNWAEQRAMLGFGNRPDNLAA